MSSLEAWALPHLAKLLPLDNESLKQIITYTASLSKAESAEHLRNLLDDSAASLEFIAGFNFRRGNGGGGVQAQSQAPATRGGRSVGNNNTGSGARRNQRQKESIHTPTAIRRPEGYGDVSGGYVKSRKEEDYIPGASSQEHIPSSSADASRNESPARRRPGKPPPSASGPLISEYLPNVRSKKAKTPGTTTPSRGGGQTQSGGATPTTTTTNNIADLTSAIAALEVSTNPKERKRRKCNCNASLHPLFTPAPNCLSCGKITCALEGLQPCSFCGTPLLSTTEIQDMIRELRAERGIEKMRAHNESVHRASGPAPAFATSSDSKLEAAKAHRDKLLSFQAQNAQRTRIVDEAADFDIPTSSSTQWMTPAQRALALKKQQRLMREMEERNRPEWERRNMVMSLDIKKGKVVRTFEREEESQTPDNESEDEDEEVDQTVGAGGLSGADKEGVFARNPLLKGAGLVRPVWKAAGSVGGDSGIQTRRRKQRQTWRRVQDDDDDNERWILDGGLHGHAHEDDVGRCNALVT
ncbi:hypothetical protein CISG_09611 [Coccidioides immitis RMSCC 3703]|uniref:TRIP4/RQT4 C2HC5-type zinc finger domain-containing protein n=1 Tax=Coccidioides immitis RMSCC 3703 TaxID=454286 RepID=A0A0J8RB94_COCIT|nr:hypothetical protein CISG_09611 [Coccidioides immitis RMSCC 3703]